MKNLFTFFFIAAFAALPCALKAQNATQRIAQEAKKSAAKTLTFDGTLYTLQSAQSNQVSDVNEYLPPDQTFDNYTSLLGVWEYAYITTPTDYANAVAKTVTGAGGAVLKVIPSGKKDTRAGIIFAVQDGVKMEFNIFIFAKTKKGNIEAMQFVARGPLRPDMKASEISKETQDFVTKYLVDEKTQLSWYKKLARLQKPKIYKN